MSQRAKLFIVTAIGVIIGAAALAAVAAMGHGDEVEIQARRHSDGRVEVALKDSDGQRHLPEQRFLAPDATEGVWHSSTPLELAGSEAVDPAAVGATATAQMHGANGADMGHVTLIQGPRGILIQARLSGVPEGWHGFHIHETGSCEPDFSAAAGHYNPTGIGHGVLHEDGHHPGDTVNVYAHADGTANADQYTVDATLGAGTATLFDADGSAIIVHEGPDSYGEAPGAGARIACGVITLD